MSTIRHSLVSYVNGSNSYFTRNLSDILTIQNQSTGSAVVGLFDYDNTSNTGHRVYLLGSPTSLTNTESLFFGSKVSANRFEIRSDVSGTGAVRAICVQTGSNTDQMVLATDGTVTLSGTTNSTSVATGTLVLSNGGLGLSGNLYAGGSASYFTGGTDGVRSVSIQNTSTGSSALSALYFRTDSASTGHLFKNSTNRASDGGVNAMTLRNEDGDLRLLVNASGSSRGMVVAVTTGDVSFSSTTASTSSEAGAVVLSGGLSISKSTEATSSTEGGAATIAGGLAVAKKIYGGSKAYVGTTTGSGILNLAYNEGSDQISFVQNAGTVTSSVFIDADDHFLVKNSQSGASIKLQTTSGDVVLENTSLTFLTANSSGTSVNKVLTVGNSYSNAPSDASKFIHVPASTWTDSTTAASGTATQDFTAVKLDQPTVDADNLTVTTTNASTLYIANSPAPGTNQTLTNRYALNVNSGVSRFGDSTATTSTSSGSVIIAGGVNITNTTDSASATSGGALFVQGGATVAKKLRVEGNSYFNSTMDMLNHKIVQLANPTQDQDAATKYYVDGVAQGLRVKDAVIARTTTEGTLATSYANGSVIDGVTLATGDRILVADQSSAVQNGIYVVNASGAPTRAADFNTGASAAAAFVFVQKGTQYADSGWVCTNDRPDDVIGTNNLVFVQFSAAGQSMAGLGLSKVGNQLDVNVDDASIEIVNDILRIKSTFAGTGLTGGSGSDLNVDSSLTHVTEVGTLTVGTWQASTVAVSYGGTGATTFTSGKLLYGNGTGALQVDSSLDFNSSTKTVSCTNLTVTGAISAGVSNPTITLSSDNLVNITSTANITLRNSKIFKNGDQNIVRATFTVTPIAGNTKTEFRFSATNLATVGNTWDVVGSVNAWHVTNDVNVENAFVLGNTSSNNVRVIFTAVDNTSHVIQVVLYYTTTTA